MMSELLAKLTIMLGVAVLLSALFALPVMWLWNVCLVPAIPGVVEVTYLQAWGLMILCSFLFKDNGVKIDG